MGSAFCVLSFLIANLGLDAIIAYSMPVLMFLYPLAIVLILLTLCGKFFRQDRTVLRWTIGLHQRPPCWICSVPCRREPEISCI